MLHGNNDWLIPVGLVRKPEARITTEDSLNLSWILTISQVLNRTFTFLVVHHRRIETVMNWALNNSYNSLKMWNINFWQRISKCRTRLPSRSTSASPWWISWATAFDIPFGCTLLSALWPGLNILIRAPPIRFIIVGVGGGLGLLLAHLCFHHLEHKIGSQD